MHILITGGSRGIGAEAVRYFTAQGHRVRFFYHRSRAQAEALARETGAEAVPCDVADPEAVNAGLRDFGPVDVLINNAAIAHYGLINQIGEETWNRLFAVNVNGVYHCVNAVLPGMLRNQAGCIINLASKEYSRAVLPHLPPSVRVVSCVFGELRPDGKVVEKGTLCKMARGEMVRWLAETGTTHPDGLPAFQGLGYRYDPDRSTGARMVFLKTTQSSAV